MNYLEVFAISISILLCIPNLTLALKFIEVVAFRTINLPFTAMKGL
jgi:hypothetical protein